MTCAELEILLCDYVDGTLHAAGRTALENHLAGCAGCKQLAEDVSGVTAFIERVPQSLLDDVKSRIATMLDL